MNRHSSFASTATSIGANAFDEASDLQTGGTGAPSPSTPITSTSNADARGNGAAEVHPLSSAAPIHSVIVADASKVSSRNFFDAIMGDSPEQREERREMDRQRCIAAILRGNTWGFPPVMVEDCKRRMVEQAEDDAALVYVERIAPGRVAL